MSNYIDQQIKLKYKSLMIYPQAKHDFSVMTVDFKLKYQVTSYMDWVDQICADHEYMLSHIGCDEQMTRQSVELYKQTLLSVLKKK